MNINISEIDDFPRHPFKVIKDVELNKMVESIKENGVLSPVLIRKKR